MNKQIFCIFSAISIILLGCSSSNVSDPASSIPSVSFPVSSYEGKEQISDEIKASVISSIKNSFKSLSSLEDNYASYYNSNASLKDLANGYHSWGSGTEAHSLTIYNNHFSSWESTTKYEIHNGDVNTFESYSSIVETLPMKSSSTPNENYQLFSKTTSSRGGYQNRGEKYTLKNPSFCSESTLDAAWDGYTADSVYAYLIRENYTFYQVGDDVHMVSRFQDVTSYEKTAAILKIRSQQWNISTRRLE